MINQNQLQSTQAYDQGTQPRSYDEKHYCTYCGKELEETDDVDTFGGRCIECVIEHGTEEEEDYLKDMYDVCCQDIIKGRKKLETLDEIHKKFLSAEFMIQCKVDQLEEQLEQYKQDLENVTAQVDDVRTREDIAGGNILFNREKKLRLENAIYK